MTLHGTWKNLKNGEFIKFINCGGDCFDLYTTKLHNQFKKDSAILRLSTTNSGQIKTKSMGIVSLQIIENNTIRLDDILYEKLENDDGVLEITHLNATKFTLFED